MIFVESTTGLISYVGVICSAAGLILLSLGYDFYQKKIVFSRVVPFVLVASIYLATGNRQYFFFGILIIVMQFSLYSSVGFRKFFLILVILGSSFCVLMLSFQYSRQPFAHGKQYSFIKAILDLDCTNSYIEDNPALVTPMAYLFTYYGVQYQGLSLYLSIDRDNIDLPPVTSLTIPVLYRRISNVMGLPSDVTIFEGLRGLIYEATGMFPRFWVTMYGSIYLEIGRLGMILFSLILGIMNYFLIKDVLLKCDQNSFFKITFFYASLIFGIMYLVLFEPIFFFVVLFCFMYRVFSDLNLDACVDKHVIDLRKL